MSDQIQRIGVAVVEQSGRFLIGIRPEGVPLAGMAEFPGGKCAAEETPAQCAVRECLEETGLAVEAVALLHRVEHAYAHGRVELYFWECRLVDPRAAAESHQGFRWIAANELRSLKFPEANAAVIELLAGDKQ